MSRKNAAKSSGTLFDTVPIPSERVAGAALESATSLRRSQLMGRIMDLNTTAREEYLAGFSEQSLQRYLAHLESMGSPRGARWERPGDSPAIMVRETTF